MSLAPAIQEACGAIIQQGRDMKAVLHALRQMPLPAAARMEVINGYGILCGMIAAANQLQSVVGAARMTGELPAAAVPVQALELHPRQRALSPAELASLHRAGDHTLDDDETAALRGATEVEEAA